MALIFGTVDYRLLLVCMMLFGLLRPPMSIWVLFRSLLPVVRLMVLYLLSRLMVVIGLCLCREQCSLRVAVVRMYNGFRLVILQLEFRY